MTKIFTTIISCLCILNLYAQCPTISPNTTNGCGLSGSSVQLGASGSSGNYNWYSSLTGGTYLGSGSTFNTPLISTSTNYFVAATNTPSALTLDGSNDYVALNMSFTTQGGISQLTVEAWVNTSESGTGNFNNWAIIDFDRSEYFNLFVSGSTGQVGFSTTNTTGTIHDFYSGSGNAVNDGSWHHIAAVYNGTDKIIYIDGIEVARSVNPHSGDNLGTGTNRFGFIGDGSESSTFNGSRNNLFYNGSINEVRIWNTTRTASEILNNKDLCLSGSEANLSAYYNFDEASGTTLIDVSGNGNTGTLFNFNTTIAWSIGNPISCPICESARTLATANIIGAGLTDQKLNCGSSSFTLDAGPGFSSYLWSTGATSQTINTSEQGIYTFSASGAGGCSVNDTASVVGFTSSGNSLDFDGSNDRIAIQTMSYNSAGLTELTVEAWIKTNSGGNQVIASFDRNQFWRLEINGNGAGTGQIGFDLMTSTGQLDFGSTSRVDDGNWHHVAGVFDNGTVSIYIDGVLDASTTTGSAYGTNTNRFGFVGIGSEASSFNGSTGPNSEYNGEMDEFRIWNVARSQNEIRNGMCAHISGNTTGLQVYYKFDEPSGPQVNDYNTSTIANGTMVNFGGAAHTGSDVPLGDVSTFTYTNSWAGQTINLNSCDGDNVILSNITGDPSGTHLYFVNNNPSDISGIVNYNSGNHYYGSFIANGATPQHDIKWEYPGHNLVLPADESELSILTRVNNSATPWTLSSSIVNTSLQEVNLSGQNSSQFILDKFQIAWTGATNTNWAIGTNWNIGSVPPSGANILIPNVINQPILDQDRLIGSLTMNNSADADLNGFNLSLTQDFTNNGAIIANNGAMSFVGTSSQLIIANSDLSLFNLLINNNTGVSLTNGTINLSGSLTLTDGLFNTNNSVVLTSTAASTGRIAEITGGSLTGNITMQRFLSAGATSWRYLTSAISGTTIEDFSDDFLTTGFIGSNYPPSPINPTPFVSIYTYNEPTPGIIDSGFVHATNITNPIGVGQGIWAWVDGNQVTNLDVVGSPNVGNINLPVSFTNNGTPSQDGWNLVGNPYPSSIDWDSPGITKTNVNNATYIWDVSNQQFASYVAGIGANGGSRNIASSQAFWVQANSAGPSIQVTESSKTATDIAFLKPASSIAPLRIKTQNTYGSDEIVINFQPAASVNFDGAYDAKKIASSNPNLPKSSSLLNGIEYSINQINPQQISIPIKILTGVTGNHVLKIENAYNFNPSSCLILEDLFTGTLHDLFLVDSFSTTIYDTTQTARFLLHIGAAVNIDTTSVSSFGNNDGKIVYTRHSNSSFDVIWKDSLNAILQSSINVFTSDSLTNLTKGTYYIEATDLLCGNTTDTIIINEPSQIITSIQNLNITDKPKVWISNNHLIIKGNFITSITVKNLLGQLLFTNQNKNIEEHVFNLNQLSSQILIVTTESNKNVSSKKVIFVNTNN